MEQQVKQNARPVDAATEQTDETLSVVRQMIEAETRQKEPSGAKNVAAKKNTAKSVAPEAISESELNAAKPSAKVRKKTGIKKSNAKAKSKPTTKPRSDLPAGFVVLPETEAAPAPRRNPIKGFFTLGAQFKKLVPRRKKTEPRAEPEPMLSMDIEPVSPAVVDLPPQVDAQTVPQIDTLEAPQVQASQVDVELDVEMVKQTVSGNRTLGQAIKQLIQSKMQAIKEFRPTRKQIAAIVVVAIMLWRPWLIPGLLVVTMLAAVIGYLTLGPDRVSEITSNLWERFSTRYPERAAVMLGKIQRGADRIDGWLARLPDRWTDGLYMPDFGRSEAEAGPVDAQPDPFERLAAEQQAMAARARQA